MRAKASSSVLLAALVLSASACSFDKRKPLAYDTLFAPDGTEREEVFLAALRERFKPGTPVQALTLFAAANQGDCSQHDPAATTCEIPVRGGWCWARLLRVEARSVDGMLTSTKFLFGSLGC